jgi:hypothetical protein
VIDVEQVGARTEHIFQQVAGLSRYVIDQSASLVDGGTDALFYGSAYCETCAPRS